MDVLVTGGDTDLGRMIAEGFRDAGHQVVIAGARRDDLEVAAKELDVDAIVFDNTDPASLEEARAQFPHHLDTIVNVPAPRWDCQAIRAPTRCPTRPLRGATRWTRPWSSAALTVQILGDHLRSGGSIVNVVPENPREGSAEAAIKAAVSDWTAGQAAHFGTRGITVNAVASGRSAEPGYEGLSAPRRRWPRRSRGWRCSSPRRPPGTSPARHCTSATGRWPTSADIPHVRPKLKRGDRPA